MVHMRDKIKWGVAAVMVLVMAGGCNTGQRIYMAEQKDIANIRQPLQNEKKNGVDTANLQKVITYVDHEGKQQMITSAELDTVTGEYITSMKLDEVVVVAKSKTVPERDGKVNIDFIVQIPGRLMQPDWRLVIAPVLNNGGVVTKLDSIDIRGKENDALFQRKRVSETRNAKRWMKQTNAMETRTGLVFSKRDRTGQAKAAANEFERIEKKNGEVRSGMKLDTVMAHDGDFFYYYTQTFPANDMQAKLKVYFNAYITNCGEKVFQLEKGDTLNYFISSMMQFLDRAPRFKRKLVQRRVTESATANIMFEKGMSTVNMTLGNNGSELARISDKMHELNNSNEFVIDSIVLTAYCSPEGFNAVNRVLAEKRAQALKQHLLPVISTNAEAVDLLKIHSTSEDWVRTRELVATDNGVFNRNDILRIIDTEPNFDRREELIRIQHPTDYQYILENIYPKVRNVDFKFYLARRNMVEEFMYTDVIDTLYAEAIKLMDQRKYKEAMPKLYEYEDWNTAICAMSLGYNGQAWNILVALPKSADREYLLAILAARMGKTEMAVQFYMDACRMDESKIMRGELDPEISQLIKKYGLNNDWMM